jgi:O-antigen ligase
MNITPNLQLKKLNIYDKLLMMFIALQVFGMYGGALVPIRIAVILLSPFVLTYFIKYQSVSKRYRYEQLLFGFWLFYGIITLFWAIIPEESIKEIIYLTINFLLIFTVLFLANKASNPQESVIKGWILMFLLTVPIALYEFWFNKHLPMAVQAEGMMMNIREEFINRRLASVTFGNLNGYNTMLCFMMPFVFNYLLKAINNRQKLLRWVMVFCLSLIVLMNGSRGAVICLIIVFLFFLKRFLQVRKSLFFLSAIALIASYFLITYYDTVLILITYRFQHADSGNDDRLKLIACGWDALWNSGLFGVGAGNFKPTMKLNYHLELTSPHNLFLEIGVQYGLIILLLFIGLLVRLFLKQKVNIDKSAKFIVLSSLFMFPLSSSIDSGYILTAGVWLFIASLHVMADKKYNKKLDHNG